MKIHLASILFESSMKIDGGHGEVVALSRVTFSLYFTISLRIDKFSVGYVQNSLNRDHRVLNVCQVSNHSDNVKLTASGKHLNFVLRNQ